MKKIVSIILTIVCIFSVCSINCYAYDSYVTNGFGETRITYHQQSDYSILIPETIDANAGSYTFQAGMLNITDSEKIYVKLSNPDSSGRILFTHEDGEHTMTKPISTEFSNPANTVGINDLPENCVGYFYGDDYTSKMSFNITDECYDCDYPRAGDYTATVTFEVMLTE